MALAKLEPLSRQCLLGKSVMGLLHRRTLSPVSLAKQVYSVGRILLAFGPEASARCKLALSQIKKAGTSPAFIVGH